MSDIIVKFQPQGERRLIEAINKLQRATGAHTTTIVKNTVETKKNEKAQKGLVRNTRLLDNSFATLRSNLLLVNFALSLGAVQLQKFAQQAAILGSMETAFVSLSGGTDLASDAINKLREATNNTMSDFDLFQQANNAMILGVTNNADEMATLFDMAQRLGRAMGLDTKRSVQSLVEGLGRQSRQMLDNIGITVSAEEAYKKYAQANDLLASALTDAEKKQAFMNEVLEKGSSAVEKFGPEILSVQDSYDQLEAATVNLNSRIGEVINDGFLPLVKASTDFINSIDTEKIRLMVELLISAVSVFIAYKAQIALAAIGTRLLAAAKIALVASVGGLTFAFRTFFTVLLAGFGPIALFTTLIGGATFALLRYRGTFKPSAKEAVELNQKIGRLNQTIENTDATKATKTLDEFLQKLIEGNSILSISAKSFNIDLINAVKTFFAERSKIMKEFENDDLFSSAGLVVLEQQFKELLGVESDFFNKFLQDSSLLNLTTMGLITTEEDFLAVLEVMVDKNSKLNDELVLQIIKERSLNKEIKEKSSNMLDFTKHVGESDNQTVSFLETQKLLTQEFLNSDLAQEQFLNSMIEIAREMASLGLLNEQQLIGLGLLEEKYADLVFAQDSAGDSAVENSIKFTDALATNLSNVGAIASAFADIEKMSGASARRVANIQHIAAISNTASAATQVLADDNLGTTGKFLAMAAVIAAGTAQVMTIENSLKKLGGSGSSSSVGTGAPVGSFEHGGYVGGQRHSQGGTIIEAEQGEFVMSRNAVESIGLETLNQMNQGGSTGNIVVNVSGNVMTQDFVEGELAEAIKEAARRGSDFGLS